MLARRDRQEREPLSQLATRIPKPLHRELKLHCVTADVKLMGFARATPGDVETRRVGAAVRAQLWATHREKFTFPPPPHTAQMARWFVKHGSDAAGMGGAALLQFHDAFPRFSLTWGLDARSVRPGGTTPYVRREVALSHCSSGTRREHRARHRPRSCGRRWLQAGGAAAAVE